MRILALVVAALLFPSVTRATVGFAESSTYYHLDSESIVEALHSDVCQWKEDAGVEIVEQIPGKDCFYLHSLPFGQKRPLRTFTVPVHILGFTQEVTASSPSLLLWNTAYFLYGIVGALLGAWYLIRRAIARVPFRPREIVIFLITVPLLLRIAWALRALFPVPPSGNTKFIFLGLLLNQAIVSAPALFYFCIALRSAPGAGRAKRGVCLASACLSGILMLPLLFSFPTLMVLFFVFLFLQPRWKRRD